MGDMHIDSELHDALNYCSVSKLLIFVNFGVLIQYSQVILLGLVIWITDKEFLLCKTCKFTEFNIT